MLEGIIQIGNAILSKDSNLLSNLIQEVEPLNNKGKQRHVLKFCFNTKENNLIIDCKEEIDRNTALKYVFIGSADGPNSPQWFATSSSYFYHITETIYNLSMIDLGETLNYKVKDIFKQFYVDLGAKFKSKNRYILDFKKCGLCDKNALDTLNEVLNDEKEKDEKQKYKNAYSSLKKTYSKEFEQYIKNQFDMKTDEIGLYTIFIDGEPLCSKEEYRKAVLKSKQNEKSKIKIDGCCSMCGSKENLTSELSKMQIKYYTTNQIIFASGFNDYNKNMLLCDICLNKLIAGENYIKNKLDTRLMGFTVYLIPHFVFGTPINKDELDKVSEKVQNSFNTVKNIKSIEKLKDDIENIKSLNDENTYFLTNIMFYKRANQATKIQKLIKDVNPSVFEEIAESFYKAQKLGQNIIGQNYKLKMDLETFYFMMPIRLKNSEPMEYRSLLQIYDAIFNKQPIRKYEFIKGVISCAEIQYFHEEGYNIKKEYPIENTILAANFCIKFLQYMTCIKEEKGMDVNELRINEDMKNYISGMGYKEEECAMFLLGCLIGEVGNAQYRRMGDDKKPVLNKLNFGGVDKNKIIRLCNEVFNKLVQEKIRKYNEVTFAECKKLIDANIKSWKLNKHENLFYILSGYSYATEKIMLSGGKENE